MNVAYAPGVTKLFLGLLVSFVVLSAGASDRACVPTTLGPAKAKAIEAAKRAGLKYVNSKSLEYSRRDLTFRDEKGGIVADGELLEKLSSVFVPSKWRSVEISELENGVIQVKGVDEDGKIKFQNYRRWEETNRKGIASTPPDFGIPIRVWTKEDLVLLDQNGKIISEPSILERVGRLAIPPGWHSVRVGADKDGHIQAIGVDSSGRTQYRYHERWKETRSEDKFHHIKEFGKAIPKLRDQVLRDLELIGFPKQKTTALVVLLLERSLIRVGSKEYAEENETFGLTTLNKDHVHVSGPNVDFDFYGKEHIHHEIQISDRKIARLMDQVLELKGDHVFQYVDEVGAVRPVSAEDVNSYIKESIGPGFSAKNFRTWMGTVHAAEFLIQAGKPANKSKVVGAIKYASEKLGNTPAIAKSSYIHPKILAAYEDGQIFKMTGTAEEIVLKIIEN